MARPALSAVIISASQSSIFRSVFVAARTMCDRLALNRSLRQTITGPAISLSILGYGRVGLIVGMPIGAVRNRSLVTNPASYIFKVRDWFKMLRIHAASDSAEMVKEESFWNWPYQQFIRDSVGISIPPSRGVFQIAYREPAVSTIGYASHPEPTPGIGLRRHVLHQFIEYADSSHATSSSRIGEGCAALVMPLRPAPHYLMRRAA